MSYTPFSSFPEFLAAVRARPGMYIGGRSVNNLHFLLIGFSMAEYEYEVPSNKRLGGFDFEAFEEWIAARYNPQRLSVGSYYLARETSGSDEAGFLLWFQWYDAFRQSNA